MPSVVTVSSFNTIFNIRDCFLECNLEDVCPPGAPGLPGADGMDGTPGAPGRRIFNLSRKNSHIVPMMDFRRAGREGRGRRKHQLRKAEYYWLQSVPWRRTRTGKHCIPSSFCNSLRVSFSQENRVLRVLQACRAHGASRRSPVSPEEMDRPADRAMTASQAPPAIRARPVHPEPMVPLVQKVHPANRAPSVLPVRRDRQVHQELKVMKHLC